MNDPRAAMYYQMMAAGGYPPYPMYNMPIPTEDASMKKYNLNII